jgi:hypothetical protein
MDIIMTERKYQESPQLKDRNCMNVFISAHHKKGNNNCSFYAVSPLFRYKVQAQIMDDHNIKFNVIFDWSFICDNSMLINMLGTGKLPLRDNF